MALTSQREKFAQGLAEGLSQADAYRASFKTGSMVPATIHSEASRLAKNPQIAARVEELRAPIVERVQIKAQDIAERAWEIATYRPNGPAVMALNLLAKQFPEFSEKHEIAGDVRFRVEALQAVAEMTPEQLKALADGARS
jgi:hypothetical protein